MANGNGKQLLKKIRQGDLYLHCINRKILLFDLCNKATENYSYLSYLPLLTPPLNTTADDNQRYFINNDLLIKRIGIIAIAIFAAMLLTHLYVPLLVLGIGIVILENRLANRALYTLAIKDYLENETVPPMACKMISSNISALQDLINQKGDLTKITADNTSLLDYLLQDGDNLPTFKLFIEQPIDFTIERDKNGDGNLKCSYFSSIVFHKNPHYLECLLRSGKINVKDFSVKQQMNFWQPISHPKTATLLVKHGFDINITDEYGYSLLLKSIRENEVYPIDFMRSSYLPDFRTYIETLLDAGADPHVYVLDQGVKKNALDLAINPEIRALLASRMKAQ